MSKASELIKNIESVQEMKKLSLVDAQVRTVAQELGYRPVETAKNTADHMAFQYGDTELIVDRKGANLTFTYDGKIIHTSPESAFDLANYKDWEPINKIVKKGIGG